jgi:hypothetical protein
MIPLHRLCVTTADLFLSFLSHVTQTNYMYFMEMAIRTERRFTDVIKDMQRFWFYFQDAKKVVSVISCHTSRQGPPIFGKKPIKKIVDDIRSWPFQSSSLNGAVMFSAQLAGRLINKQCATFGEVFDIFDLSKQGGMISYAHINAGDNKNDSAFHDIDLQSEIMPSAYYMPTNHEHNSSDCY